MHLKRINGEPMLCIDPERCIIFQDVWLNALRTMQVDQYGDYLKSTVYPALLDADRKLWNKSTISNKDLHNAVLDFKD